VDYAPEVRFPGLRTAFPVALAEGLGAAFGADFALDFVGLFATGFRLVPVPATVLAEVFFLAAGFRDATFTGLASPG
jgi:hypothetical protein